MKHPNNCATVKIERMLNILRLGHLLEKSHQMAQLFDVLNLLLCCSRQNK